MAQRKAGPPGRPASNKAGGKPAGGGRTTPSSAASPASSPSSASPAASSAAASRTSAGKPSTSKPSTNKPTSSTPTSSKPSGKPDANGKSGSTAATSSTSSRATGRPPTRRPGKSIVNQKQTPWGLIVTTAAVVAFAVAIVIVVIATRKSTPAASGAGCTKMIGKNTTSYLNELQCATKIKGVTFTKEANRQHVTGNVKYDSSPPVGGNHNAFWADCTGTVYAAPIANENAVHMLEHGAVWVTYNAKTLSGNGLDTLKKNVLGVDHTALSPYPDLKTPISLQAWGYQLFVSSPTDPRIATFISDFKENPKTTPEQGGFCSQPTFKANPSTFGHPKNS